MQIIHFKKFSVSVSTGTSKVDKLLKMPPDSISEGKNFPGDMPSDPLVLCFAHYECNMPASLSLGMLVPNSRD